MADAASSVLPAAALVLGLGIGMQILAHRTRVPSIILLLAAGFAIGPWLGLLDPDALLGDLLGPIVALSVALILFEGGLDLDWREVRAHGPAVTRLVTVGVAATFAIGAVAASTILGWSPGAAALLAAILVVTGPTVVLPLLHHIRPDPDVAAVARWEGILIDPIGAVLAVVVFEGLRVGPEGLWTFAAAIGGGTALGVAGAFMLAIGERRHAVPDSLAPAAALALVVLVFVLAESFVAESGLVAATAMGIALANQRKVPIRHAVGWKEPLGAVLLGSLFLLLAARVDAGELLAIASDPRSWAFVAVLVLVARPVSVLLSTHGSQLRVQERAFLAGLAPRGIVAAAVAALFAARLPPGEALPLVPIVFFVVLVTVVLYGVLALPWARVLKVAGPPPSGILLVGANAVTRTLAEGLEEDGVRALIVDTDRQALTAARVDGLEASYGRMHADEVFEPLDLTGIGQLWAVTPHAETNALACLRFQEPFGRGNVHRVDVENTAEGRPKDRREELARGALWAIPYRTLRDRMQQGWHLRRTPITEQFGPEEHAREHPDAVRLWLARDGHVHPFGRRRPPRIRPGDFLTALVPPEA